MALHKTAVDAEAEEYYASYFGDYGKAFTRRIPRRIASWVAAEHVAAGGKMIMRAEVWPTMAAPLVHADGSATLEGRVQAVDADGVCFTRVFRATFAPNGDKRNFAVYPPFAPLGDDDAATGAGVGA